MIAAAVIRNGIMRREREAAVVRQQREAESRRNREQEKHWRTVEDAILRAQPQRTTPTDTRQRAQQYSAPVSNRSAHCNRETYDTEESNESRSTRNHIFSQDELAQARGWLAELDVGAAGVLHFSARPLTALSGTFCPGDNGVTLRVTFSERPPGASDAESLRLALRCLALLAARAAAIERACAVAAPPPDFIGILTPFSRLQGVAGGVEKFDENHPLLHYTSTPTHSYIRFTFPIYPYHCLPLS